MTKAETMTLKEVECDLIEWAESDEGSEKLATCLGLWNFDEEQLEVLRAACANHHAAASIANAMWCITDEEGIMSIAEVLRTY